MTINALLPRAFRPKFSKNLQRIGREGDGGYILDNFSLDQTRVLISLGVDKDWSFEKEFKRKKECKVICVDKSTSFKSLTFDIVKSFLDVRRPLRPWKLLIITLDYIFFLKRKTLLVHKFVSSLQHVDHCNLSSIIQLTEGENHNNGIFLKMDIEGGEYRLLAEILSYSDRLCGLIIEFHDVDLHIETILDFIDRLKLSICHVHVNETGPISEGGVPTVIEVSFSSDRTLGDAGFVEALPTSLDVTNFKNGIKVVTKFS